MRKTVIAGAAALFGAVFAVEEMPASIWYQKGIEAALHAYSDLDVFMRSGMALLPDLELVIIDSAIGRLMCFDVCLDRLSRLPFEDEEGSDRERIVQVVLALADLSARVAEKTTPERAECIIRLMNRIKERCEELIGD